ncbi:MAG: hypothetical protein WC222_09040 [Parachlamydiales bacterium]
METSYLLARIIGITLMVVYAGVLLNRNIYGSFWSDISTHPVILFITGFLSLLIGLIVVQFHNVWTPDWRIIVTLLGWLTFLSGALRILFPAQVIKFAAKFFEDREYKVITIASGLLVALGAFLTYIGYTHT